MKATGIVRACDQLGRVVIPMELRRTMAIDEGTPLEIYTDNECIVLKKYVPGCVFCGHVKDDMVHQVGKIVCPDCVKEMSKQVVPVKAASKRR